MHIEINGDAEMLIKAGLVTGDFSSAEEAVAVMAKLWAERKEIAEPNRHFSAFPKSTDIAALAAQLRFGDGAPDVWPPDESVDDFVAFIREVRRDRSPAGDFDE